MVPENHFHFVAFLQEKLLTGVEGSRHGFGCFLFMSGPGSSRCFRGWFVKHEIVDFDIFGGEKAHGVGFGDD